MKINSKEWKNLVRDGIHTLLNARIAVSDEQLEQFSCHARDLLMWNQKINLTAITDPMEIAVKHFTDSAMPVPLIPLDASLLDIGSGGGFPGIPLKILMPSLSMTLIDASRKKVNFQKHVIRSLKLGHIDAHHIRAEELVRTHANAFDVVICRAFSSLKDFILLAHPLLSSGGTMIALKGNISDDEISSVYDTFGRQVSFTVDKYCLPYLNSARSVVRIYDF